LLINTSPLVIFYDWMVSSKLIAIQAKIIGRAKDEKERGVKNNGGNT